MNNHKFIKSIKIPNNVHVLLDNDRLIFLGPLGVTTFSLSSSNEKQETQRSKELPRGFQLGFEKTDQCNRIVLQNTENSKQTQMCGNTLASLIDRKIAGVVQGFFVSLEIRGIGYRVILKELEDFSNSNRQVEQKLTFKLGYSHDVEMILPTNVRAFCPKPSLLCIYGVDYQFLSQICSKIKSFKEPEIYKGKGIRFKDEKIRLRIGKRK